MHDRYLFQNVHLLMEEKIVKLDKNEKKDENRYSL